MKEIVLIDGGLGTELTEIGFNVKGSTFWSGEALIQNPKILKKAHLNFIQNGARIIETASYNLSVEKLARLLNLTEEKAKSYVRDSVKIADQARKESHVENVLIAGSIGPYGASKNDKSEYSGSYVKEMDVQTLKDWHRPRLECLIEAKCDLIAFETIPSIKEASTLMSLLSEYPETKAWLSFTCKDETHLCFENDTFNDAFKTFKDNKQLVAIGINCTSPKFITPLLKSARETQRTSNLPFIVYPNSGNLFKNEIENPVDFICKELPEWIELGAKYVGGCCYVNSKEIGKIHSCLNKTLNAN